ncbi:gliding motility-associated C-terminal domain-containing protein [Mucilaginibacter sp. AK015]|uniref:gliding motility-associated C-terminal domain-containing protein n=1 Tax=Mucilaginibacter sp. AK015 TaxID=2723072 RepID=UPI0016079D73|nr:gliding motility-associated C-terminal domain-containing protein [Mucilaginibacter sp. AK015]MBB5396592.1 gliding motility-associated-like protein [Mucilaginibacter sp. AK015]
MLTNKLKLLLLLLMILLSARVVAQNSLGDPVLYEDFGFGTNYTPLGPALKGDYSTMKYGGDGGRCPNPGAYLILNSSSNCYGDSFKTINFDHSGGSPFGYLMMVNGDSKPVIYYTRVIGGAKFCGGARYQFAAYLNNINKGMPRPDGYVDADVKFTVKSSKGAILGTYATGPIDPDDSFVQYYVDFNAPNDGSDVIIELSNNALTGTVGNDFALDDITVKAYGPVIDVGIGTVAGPAAITVTQCLDGGPKTYVLKSLVHNYASPLYQWQLNFNNTGWKNIDGATNKDLSLSTTFLNPAVGKYQYRVGALSAPGTSLNCQTFSQAITINVVKNPDYKLPDTTTVCQGEILSIHADGGTDFYWTLPDGSHSNAHFLDVTTSASKSNEGIYRVVISRDGCSYTTQTRVVVGEPLTVTVDDASPVICEGTSVQLGVHGGLKYKWTPSAGLDHDDIPNPVASPTDNTAYNVLISNDGCTKERTIVVTVLKLPVANAGPDRTMKEGEPIKLQGSASGSNINIYWTPTEYMDDPTSLTPRIDPPDSRTYTLHVESPDNCGIVSDEMYVRVFKKLTIPSTFTPNGDGMNDTWRIDKLITYPESVLYVYTREGKEVFRTVGDAKQWNGIYQGKALPAGVYYYIIDLKNNLPKQGGWVMLLR